MRDQVLRHDPSTGVFGRPIEISSFDSLSESNVSDDRLTRAFTHISIRCNPRAPDPISVEIMQQFYAKEPNIGGYVQGKRPCSRSIAHSRQAEGTKHEVAYNQNLTALVLSAAKEGG